MRVKAAVARAHAAKLTIEDLDLVEPAAGHILVRLVASGVATSDLDAIAGRLSLPLPFVPGSEGAGIVERVADDVADVASGDAVLVIAAPFDRLDLTGRCADGSAPFLTDGAPVNGCFFGQSSFATHLVCDASRAIKLPSDSPLELMAALAGEALEGVEAAAGLAPEDVLVVTGASFLGLVAILVAKARGVGTIIVADPDEARRTIATDIGAHVVVHTDEDLSSVVKSMAAVGARVAVDTTGEPKAIEACLDSLGLGGRVVRLHHTTDLKEVVSPMDVRAMVADLAALYAEGHLPIEKLITFFPFELVDDALGALSDGSVVKPVIRFSLGSFGDLDRALTEGAATDVAGETQDADTSVPAEAPSLEDPERENVEPVPV